MDKKKPKRMPPIDTRFKKGQVANPLGGKTHNPAVRALKNLTIESYREVIELVMTGNMDALKELAMSKSASAIQVGIARAFRKAIKYGDYSVIEQIAQRIVGKIPDVLTINKPEEIDMVKLRAALAELKSSV